MGMRGEIEDKEKMDEGNEGRKTDSKLIGRWR